MEEQYESERFIMRRIRDSDAKDLLEMESDPEILKFIGTPLITDLDEIHKVIQGVHKQYSKYGVGRMAIERRSDGEVMGWTGIKLETEIRDFNYYDLGYRLKRKHWGQGIATETGKTSVEYAFNRLGLDEVNAGTDFDHYASQRVLAKLGFRQTENFQFEGGEKYFFELTKADFYSTD